MLAYAFQVLKGQGYRSLDAEDFDNVADLCATILARGVKSQLKQGLWREYINQTETLSTLRGRIDIADSIKTRAVLRRQLVCDYDEFSVDTLMNRILKSTMRLLLAGNIKTTTKKDLRRLLVYFNDVGDTNLSTVNWRMSFHRNNQTYQMLMNVCYLVVKGLLQTQDDGSVRLMDFLDEQRMSHLYEKFILEYYRQEHPEVQAEASYVQWALDDGFSDMLPAMKSDITLTRRVNGSGVGNGSVPNDVLIIAAKYYSHTLQQQFDAQTIHSNNLYQIFTYVKNKEAMLSGTKHTVSGMLLYARTDEELQPDATYRMSGNAISVKTLDLNQPFDKIRAQLDGIAADYFPSE